MTNGTTESPLMALRQQYHRNIADTILGHRPGQNTLSVADSSSLPSVYLAKQMALNMKQTLCTNPLQGQAAGARFTAHTREFLQGAFSLLQHLRPGQWVFSVSQSARGYHSI